VTAARDRDNPSKDADLARSLLLGCGIVFVLFLLGSALIAWFWLHP
jgi:hypothetical protein